MLEEQLTMLDTSFTYASADKKSTTMNLFCSMIYWTSLIYLCSTPTENIITRLSLESALPSGPTLMSSSAMSGLT